MLLTSNAVQSDISISISIHKYKVNNEASQSTLLLPTEHHSTNKISVPQTFLCIHELMGFYVPWR
jgi:hypothetical protein